MIVLLLVVPFRFRLHLKALRHLREESHTDSSIYRLPWKEFVFDLSAWFSIGILLSALYIIFYGAPFTTGISVIVACLSFGLFGGMLSLLSAEKDIIVKLESISFDKIVMPKNSLSVSRKMLFLLFTMLTVMGAVIILLMINDINYLLKNKDALNTGIYSGIFKEVIFTLVVLLSVASVILGRYSSNLKRVLQVHMTALEKVSRGNYNMQIPVVSSDEFSIIASKTNDMIEGLKDKEYCELTFGKYVTPEISTKILRGEISTEGELNEATILFCDLRGYTPFVEKRDPKEVVRFLNDYFSEMEHTIRGHNGIVLQYIGDEIEAVFGAPIEEPDHADKAVQAALEMRERLESLNDKRRSLGEEPIRHGIGIHTGVVLAGSVGSPERLVYAMVGDPVNLASRIQDLNKRYGTDILISSTTKELLKAGGLNLVGLGKTSIKGKSEEIELYKVL